MISSLATAQSNWLQLSPIVFVPRNEEQYSQLVKILDDLIDVVGEDEEHPLASLMDVLGVLIEKYEDDNIPELN